MAFGTNGNRWDNATIPYVIDEGDFPIDSDDREDIKQAIVEWNENTIIRLVPRANEGDFIVFADTGESCQSPVGRSGNRQVVSCDLEGGFRVGSVIHEIGHAVGFFHEAQRPDREEFIDVNNENIESGKEDQFAIKDGRILTDYDCGSIMHYGPTAFSDTGETTIEALSDVCASQIDQRVRLSGSDVWGAGLLYEVPMRSLVVWEDDSGGNGLFQIHASGFAGNGSRCCGPLTVNRVGIQQRTPAAGMAGNRDMVFVWADDRDGNGSFQIKVRGFGANGLQSISQRTVNTVASGNQIAPHVAVNDEGRFVVVWQDDSDGNGVYQIKARGFARDGSERFSQRTVNTRARGQQTAPRVAIAPDGFYVVAWEDDADGDGLKSIRMRGFHEDGTVRWEEKRVNTRNRGQHQQPRIAIGPFGDFVVVWEDDTDSNGFFQIRMRAFTADGNQKFSERTVNRTAAGQQIEPDVAVDDVFRPVVVWADDRDRNGFYQIRMRGFESDGRQRLSERTVNTDAAGQQRRPQIGVEANGRLTVAWEDDQDSDGQANILVRGFYTDGNELFAPRQVSNIPGGHKGRPCVVAPAMSLFDVFNPL